jgi:hypothetical protein
VWSLLAAALALLLLAPVAGADDNILSPARGARVMKRTSEDPRAPAANLIDDTATGGWRSGDGIFPQEIIFQLPAATRFDTLVLSPAPGAPVEQWPRAVEVHTADPFPTMGGWREVARVTLAPTPGDQTFTVPAIEGRFVRLVILSAQADGVPRVALGRLKIFMR